MSAQHSEDSEKVKKKRMAVDLADYEQRAHEAVQAFWRSREQARKKQLEAGSADQGERAGVTTGKNMDGFVALVN